MSIHRPHYQDGELACNNFAKIDVSCEILYIWGIYTAKVKIAVLRHILHKVNRANLKHPILGTCGPGGHTSAYVHKTPVNGILVHGSAISRFASIDDHRNRISMS
jgi:hypothetical protein